MTPALEELVGRLETQVTAEFVREWVMNRYGERITHRTAETFAINLAGRIENARAALALNGGGGD